MAYDKNTYNNQYKKDHFDHITFYAPKGTKESITKCAQSKGLAMSEYLRKIVNDAIERDAQ